jgi:hypothetical protein
MPQKPKNNRRTNGKLLDNDELSSLFLLRDFGKVDRDLRARDTDTHAVDHTTGNQRTDTVTRNLHAGSREPPETCEHD